MNFIPCRVVQNGAGLAAKISDSVSLPIPEDRQKRYAPHKDKEMTIGLRPEHMTEVKENPKPGVAPFDIKVDVVEPMGMETMVHFMIGRDAMCARVDPNTPAKANAMLPLHVDMNNMHLIDPASGNVV